MSLCRSAPAAFQCLCQPPVLVAFKQEISEPDGACQANSTRQELPARHYLQRRRPTRLDSLDEKGEASSLQTLQGDAV